MFQINAIKLRCKPDLSKKNNNGIRCIEYGGHGHIQNECVNMLKNKLSNTILHTENYYDTQHGSDEEQESNVAFTYNSLQVMISFPVFIQLTMLTVLMNSTNEITNAKP